MGLSRQEYCSGAPLNSINSHGAGSAQSLTGHPDRHHDIRTCHPRGVPFPREWEITPRKPAPSLSTASLSPMKEHDQSGNLSGWSKHGIFCGLALTLHGQIQVFFFFLSEFYLFKNFYLFIYFWPSLLHADFLQLWQVGACSLVVVGRLLMVAASLVQQASVIVAQGLSCPLACGIFPNQGLTCVPCIGRWSLNHWTTREVLY